MPDDDDPAIWTFVEGFWDVWHLEDWEYSLHWNDAENYRTAAAAALRCLIRRVGIS